MQNQVQVVMIVIVTGGKQSQILLLRLPTKSYFVGFPQNLTLQASHKNEPKSDIKLETMETKVKNGLKHLDNQVKDKEYEIYVLEKEMKKDKIKLKVKIKLNREQN